MTRDEGSTFLGGDYVGDLAFGYSSAMIHVRYIFSFTDRWDLSLESSFASKVRSRFATTVHFYANHLRHRPFKMVVCFLRFAFRISIEFVVVPLCCCLGRDSNAFQVSHL